MFSVRIQHLFQIQVEKIDRGRDADYLFNFSISIDPRVVEKYLA